MNQKLKIILIVCFSTLTWSQDCCEEADVATDNCGGLGCYIPQCTEDCDWEPMQCWGSTGYCWCVDDYGTEIEGTSIPSWQGFPDCEEHLEECFDFSGIEFGPCEMVLGVGLLNDECSYISGCDWTIDGIDYSDLFFDSMDECDEQCSNGNICDEGYIEINNLCFHQGDIDIIQLMIDNSYQSDIDLDCQDGDIYCGSPNPFMDTEDFWGWVAYDGITYNIPANENGVVEPLELGIQEWENGRLTSLMCGAYIYCQLSGPIPYEINTLTELKTFRVEGNYFSGIIPETICDLDIDYDNMLEFDVRYNQLCEPYPYCINDNDDFWSQYDEVCSEIGDVNYDGTINVLDVISITSIILSNDTLDYQAMLMSDVNYDGLIDVLDIIIVVEIILN